MSQSNAALASPFPGRLRPARSFVPGRGWRHALFALPYFVAFFALLVYPLVDGLWLSVHKVDLFGSGGFVGWSNYLRLGADPIFVGAARNTLLFVLFTVPPLAAVGLALALALNRPGRLAGTLRGVFFASSVLSVTIVALIWRMVFIPDRGLLTNALALVGHGPVVFLNDASLALPAVAIATVWWCIGLPMMLFLAALQQVPAELYEAAALDNATRWQAFRHITLPSIRRTVTLVLIIQFVLQFQVFGQTQLMTQGGPGNRSRSISFFIYEKGFRNWDIGYAAAASQVLFAIILLAAVVQYLAVRREART